MCLKFQLASNQNLGKTPNIILQTKTQMVKYYRHLKTVIAILVILAVGFLVILCFLTHNLPQLGMHAVIFSPL